MPAFELSLYMLGAGGRVWDRDYQAPCTGMSLRLMLQAVNNLVSAPDPNQPQRGSLPVSRDTGSDLH